MSLFMMKGVDNPWVRLATALVAVFALVGAMRFLFVYSNPGQASQEWLQGINATMVNADPQAGADPLANLPGDETLYHSTEAELISSERAQRAGELSDIQHPVMTTAAWVKGRPADWLKNNALPRSVWHYENVVREPSRWRFQPMHVYGMLADENTIEFPENPPGLRKMFWLTLYDPFDEVFFTVLTPRVPRDRQVLVESASGRRAVKGTYLACDGVFLMAFPFYTNHGTQDTPLFYAPEVVAASEDRTPPPLLDGRGGRPFPGEGENNPKKTVPGLDVSYLRSKIYNPPKSGDITPQFASLANDLREEKTGLMHVFEYLAGVPDHELHQMADNPEINYVTLMAGDNAPEWMMGQATSFTGVVFSMDTLRFPTNEDGVDRIYLVTAGDLQYQNVGGFTWVAAVLHLPEGMRRGDRITVDGLFLKLYPYRTKGNQWHWSPLLMAKTVKLVPPRLSPFLPAFVPDYLWPWIGGAVLLLAFAASYWLWRLAREDNRRMEKMKQNLRHNPAKGKFNIGKRTAAVLRRAGLRSAQPTAMDAADGAVAGDAVALAAVEGMSVEVAGVAEQMADAASGMSEDVAAEGGAADKISLDQSEQEGTAVPDSASAGGGAGADGSADRADGAENARSTGEKEENGLH